MTMIKMFLFFQIVIYIFFFYRVKNAKGIYRPRLLISGGSLSEGQGPHLAQALLYCMEHLPVQILDVSTLFAESARSPEETCVQVI